MMNRIKSIAVILMLLVLTAAIVFVPYIVSEKSGNQRRGEKSYWNYSTQKVVNITDKQVALLYYNGKIDIDMYERFDRPTAGENNGMVSKKDDIEKDVFVLFDNVFAKNETICSCMKEMFDTSNIDFSQTEVLTMLDERPIVLNVVCVVAQTVHGTMEITYEQKSHTLLNFTYYSVFPLDETNSIKSKILVEEVSNYYTNQLELNNKQFYAHYETIEKSDFKDYCVSFGIYDFQNGIEVEKEESDVIVLPF